MELKRIPETLHQTHNRILHAVPRLHQPWVQSALYWLAFAARPLVLSELAEAVVINPRKSALNHRYTLEAMANKSIAECCLNYLLAFSLGRVTPQPSFKDFPLLFYTYAILDASLEANSATRK
jgi:hypothetical protein